MMMSGEEEKDVQAPESSTIEAPCPPADPGDGGGGGGYNNNGAGECMAIVVALASEGETKIVTNINKEDGWEAARAWLMTLPRRRNVMHNEIEDWLHHNKHNLSREITTMPRQHLYRYLVSQHKLIRRADQPQSPQQQTETAEWLEPPTARFKRSDKWKPIYSWLESLDAQEIVRTKTIGDWLTQNPDVREDLESKHSRYHLIHYIQKCHAKILKKKEKQKNIQNSGVGSSGGLKRRHMSVNGGSMQRDLSADHQYGHSDGLLKDSRNSDTVEKSVVQKGDLDGGEALPKNNIPGFIDGTSSELKNNYNRIEQEHGNGTLAMALTRLDSGDMLKHNSEDTDNLLPIGRDEAVRKYELLSELENRLITLLSNFKQQSGVSNLSTVGVSLPSQWSAERNGIQFLEGNDDAEGRTKRKSRDSIQSQQELASHSTVGQARLRSSADAKLGRKRKKAKDNSDISVYAWARSEAHADIHQGRDTDNCVDTSQTSSQEAEHRAFTKQYRPNIVKCLQGQEGGLSWPLTSSPNGHCGRRQQKWRSLFEGWDSLGKQFEGPAVWLERKAYSSWIPTWSAYTSSVALAQPLGRMDQGVQKVLDVRFHPNGMAQLVCSSNEAPNELLLYNLIAGRATELAGHNCQIQAVEYAAGGASIVSCGGNLVKVWDSTSGACLYTLGPVADNVDLVGHKKKINAMAVNSWQSCLVATSGGESDGRLLLWNVLLGELAADINVNMRENNSVYPSIDAMEFCNQNLLVCGSDSAYGGPAMVQLWDIEAPQGCASFPANDAYITSLKIHPTCNTVITGAGDGTVGLFDIRTCGGICRLSVGSNFEVTSVSFSSCGTYFHASSTANATLVWDTRMMPMNHGPMTTERPLPVTDPTLHSARPLHCLSHGKQMPTAEHAGQLPGFVDEGDQGVNDVRWFHNMPVLVTASGNGSIAMWNVTLGQPCIRHLSSHTRCANTVAVASNDEYICSGGDDQKVVLYHDLRGRSNTKWRLTHPLSEVQIN